MNIDDLKGAIAEKADISKADAGKVITALFDSIQDTLCRGGKVAIPGFGTFDVADRPARQGRNPQTGAAIQIAASKAPKFKAGKGLKDALNG